MRKLAIRKKIGLVIWKNLVAFQCIWVRFLLETIFKFYLIIVAYYILRHGVEFEPIWPLRSEEYNPLSGLTIFYSPNNTNIGESMMKALQKNEKFENVQIIPFNTPQLMEIEWVKREATVTSKMRYVAITFRNVSHEALKYDIRVPGRIDSQRLHIAAHRYIVRRRNWRRFYCKFLSIQSVLESTYISIITGKSVTIPTPEPLGKVNDFGRVYKTVLLLLFSCCIGLITILPILRRILNENEKNLNVFRETLGITNFFIWFGRLVDVFIKAAITDAALTIAYHFVLRIPWYILWVYLLLYTIKSATYTFFWICVCRANVTTLIAMIIIWFVSFHLAKSYVVYSNAGFSFKTQYLVAFIFPNAELGLALQEMVILERQFISKQAPQWTPFIEVVGISIGSSVVYFILTLIFGKAWHPTRGLTWPNRQFFLRRKLTEKIESSVSRLNIRKLRGTKPLQQPPWYLYPQLRVRNFVKYVYSSYGTKTVLIDDISFDIFANEVAFILGETGCGKSTLIGLLAGEVVADKGTVYFGRMDINDDNDLNLIRSQIGYCPQENIFPKCLTVKQLLKFVAGLRDLPSERVEEEANNLLDSLDLNEVADEFPDKLPNSVARVVSFAMAVVGRQPIILLDDPTRGVDTDGRQRIWNMIKKMRHNRVIVVATNLMNEIDDVADRIILLKDGKLQCWGTPMFLKEYFGGCLELRIQRNNNNSADNIRSVILNYAGDVHISWSRPGIIVCKIPLTAGPRVKMIVKKLRRHRVTNMAISVCNMEDIFLKATKSNHTDESRTSLIMETTQSLEQTNDIYEYKPPASCTARFAALFAKECILVKRSWSAYIFTMMIAMVIIGCIILVCELALFRNADISTLLSLSMYKGIVMFEEGKSKEMAFSYRELVEENGATPRAVENIYKEYEKAANKDMQYCNIMMLIGARLIWKEENNTLVPGIPMYSHSMINTGPVSLNLLSNAVLRALNFIKVYIELNNHPLPKKDPHMMVDWIGIGLWSELMPLLMALCMVVMARSAHEDMSSGCYRVQMRQGMSPLQLWIARFASHLTLYLIFICLLTFVVFICSVKLFSCPSEIGSIILVWIVYGFAGIPFIYLLSRIFSSMMNIVICITAIVVASGTLVIMQDAFVLKQNRFSTFMDVVTYIFPCHIASICMGHLMRSILRHSPCRLRRPRLCPLAAKYEHKIRQRECLRSRDHLKDIGEYLLIQFVQGVVYLLIVIVLDTQLMKKLVEHILESLKFLRRIWINVRVKKKRRVIRRQSSTEVNKRQTINETDSSLMGSKDNVHSILQPDDFLVFSNVVEERKRAQKEFDSMPTVPPNYKLVLPPAHNLVAYNICLPDDGVNKSRVADEHRRLSFRVRAGEALALMGPRRAGGRHLLNILAGQRHLYQGDVAGVYCRLRDRRREYIKHVGYFGEKDGLLHTLTTEEHVNLICRLRGIRSDEFKNKWMSIFGLQKRLKFKTEHLTLSERRVLLVAIAFIAEPSVVLLNEPAMGVDPRTRRRLAAAFSLFRSYNRSFVITTNNLDDAEALCHRVAVLEDVVITCLDTILNVRNTLCEGYVVTVELGNEERDTHPLKEAIQKQFGNEASIFEYDQLKARIRVNNMRCERLFERVMQILKLVPTIRLDSIREISAQNVLVKKKVRKNVNTARSLNTLPLINYDFMRDSKSGFGSYKNKPN